MDTDDRALVRAYLDEGSQDAFRTLVRRYERRVFRLAVSVLGHAHSADAEEVAQEAFVRAFRELPRFRGESQFGVWLYRIAYNLAVDCKRRARWRFPHAGESALASRAAEAPSPDADLESARREQALLECIEQLPDLYQTVIRLHYWTEASIDEIAEILQAPEGTVKSYLFRARRRLEELLERKGVDRG